MRTERDPGRPIAYEALAIGTPVHDQQGQPVGTVKQVLAVEEEDVFDGLVIETDEERDSSTLRRSPRSRSIAST
jgi:hypothetical protein